jgi:hypothetical protein
MCLLPATSPGRIVGFLLGLGAQVSGYTSPALAMVCFGGALLLGLWALATWRPFAERVWGQAGRKHPVILLVVLAALGAALFVGTGWFYVRHYQPEPALCGTMRGAIFGPCRMRNCVAWLTRSEGSSRIP